MKRIIGLFFLAATAAVAVARTASVAATERIAVAEQTGATGGIAVAESGTAIPDDPEILIGKLPNGLTYYIVHNANPAGCADFYIVHNVGALQEEDNQNGLAHFLEHMAFNGTKHYPGKSLMGFLSKEGVRFGYNVNAYTNKTETVYNISSVPLVRESFVDSVLMILHDWSCDISCEQGALDEERGVISEEWRRRDAPRDRMMYRQNELIYKGAKHERRTVLGTLEVINGFVRDEIMDFYHTWYRPDLQAIIVVGDFDAARMETKVRQMFSDIPARVNPQPKEDYPIPALQEPLFENMLDAQVKYHVLKVIHKQPFPAVELRSTEEFYRDLYARQIVSTIMDERISQKAKEKNSPLTSAVMVTSPYGADFYVSLFTLSMKGAGNMEEALEFITRETERLLRYGFTREEFEAAKYKLYKKYRMNTESFPEDVTSEQIVDVCKENFLRGYAACSPFVLKEIQKVILSELSYEQVKGYEQQMFRDSEKIYSYCMNVSEAQRIPSPQRMQEIIAQTISEELQPEYLTYQQISLSADPQPGSVVSVKALKGTEAGEKWILSNGAAVYWTPSDSVKSNTHLSMNVYFNTGYAALPQETIRATAFVSNYLYRHLGFGQYDLAAIKNSPEFGGISFTLHISRQYSDFRISSDRASVERCFAMFHSVLTEPYFSTEAALNKLKQNRLNTLSKDRGPVSKFEDEVKAIRYVGHPWMTPADSAAVQAVDMDLIKDIFFRSYGDPSRMEVFISSDLDREEILALVEKYIASLSDENAVDYDRAKVGRPLPAYEGEVVLERSSEVETVPKSTVSYSFKTSCKFSPKNRAIIEYLDYIMSERYMMQIREARGGTYHVSFVSEPLYSAGLLESTVSFQTRPELTEILVGDVEALMAQMADEGPTAQEMDQAMKYFIKRRAQAEALNANSLTFKNSECSDLVRYGISSDYDYTEVIRSVTAKDIRKFARRLSRGDTLLTIYSEK